MKAYFELLAHPAKIILYTDRELRASRNRTPYRRLTAVSGSVSAARYSKEGKLTGPERA